MAKVRVEMNDAGARELLKSAGVRADLENRAARVKAAAEASAPVDTGEYRDSFVIETSYTSERVRVEVASTDPKANVIEAHTGNLARALDAAGGA